MTASRSAALSNRTMPIPPKKINHGCIGRLKETVNVHSHITCLTICSFLLLFPYACTREVQETRLFPKAPSFTMIIASDSSEFKDSIREMVIARYRQEGGIEVVNVKKLKDINPLDYDVVVIIDTTLAWSGFNPSLKSFLENNEYKDNVVVCMTAADPDWAYSYQGVDAITAASVVENEQDIFEEISLQIDQILDKK